MLLLIVLVSVIIYPIDSLNTVPFSEPETPVDTPIQRTQENNEQPVAIQGQFIIAEGNSDHLFRSYDFMKEEAVQLGEGDTEDRRNEDKVRRPCDALNSALPRIEIIEGHFISDQNESDEHLFDQEEDFTKHDAILN